MLIPLFIGCNFGSPFLGANIFWIPLYFPSPHQSIYEHSLRYCKTIQVSQLINFMICQRADIFVKCNFKLHTLQTIWFYSRAYILFCQCILIFQIAKKNYAIVELFVVYIFCAAWLKFEYFCPPVAIALFSSLWIWNCFTSQINLFSKY